jgi:hypothetical protein
MKVSWAFSIATEGLRSFISPPDSANNSQGETSPTCVVKNHKMESSETASMAPPTPVFCPQQNYKMMKIEVQQPQGSGSPTDSTPTGAAGDPQMKRLDRIQVAQPKLEPETTFEPLKQQETLGVKPSPSPPQPPPPASSQAAPVATTSIPQTIPPIPHTMRPILVPPAITQLQELVANRNAGLGPQRRWLDQMADLAELKRRLQRMENNDSIQADLIFNGIAPATNLNGEDFTLSAYGYSGPLERYGITDDIEGMDFASASALDRNWPFS